MLMYEIVGIRKYQFNDEKSGRVVSGKTLYCTFSDPDISNLNGKGTIDFNISDAKLGSYLPEIGDEIFVSWADKRNRRVDAVILR